MKIIDWEMGKFPFQFDDSIPGTPHFIGKELWDTIRRHNGLLIEPAENVASEKSDIFALWEIWVLVFHADINAAYKFLAENAAEMQLKEGKALAKFLRKNHKKTWRILQNQAVSNLKQAQEFLPETKLDSLLTLMKNMGAAATKDRPYIWEVAQKLRNIFPELLGNHEISETFEHRKKLPRQTEQSFSRIETEISYAKTEFHEPNPAIFFPIAMPEQEPKTPEIVREFENEPPQQSLAESAKTLSKRALIAAAIAGGSYNKNLKHHSIGFDAEKLTPLIRDIKSFGQKIYNFYFHKWFYILFNQMPLETQDSCRQLDYANYPKEIISILKIVISSSKQLVLDNNWQKELPFRAITKNGSSEGIEYFEYWHVLCKMALLFLPLCKDKTFDLQNYLHQYRTVKMKTAGSAKKRRGKRNPFRGFSKNEETADFTSSSNARSGKSRKLRLHLADSRFFKDEAKNVHTLPDKKEEKEEYMDMEFD